jgi:hypothetical protein
MILNRYSNLVEAQSSLKEKGYTDEFTYQEEESVMKSNKTDKKYAPEEMKIIEFHRFEGMTNPGDMSIIFAVECVDGAKGVVLSSFGVYADLKLAEFMDKVKIKARE